MAGPAGHKGQRAGQQIFLVAWCLRSLRHAQAAAPALVYYCSNSSNSTCLRVLRRRTNERSGGLLPFPRHVKDLAMHATRMHAPAGTGTAPGPGRHPGLPPAGRRRYATKFYSYATRACCYGCSSTHSVQTIKSFLTFIDTSFDYFYYSKILYAL